MYVTVHQMTTAEIIGFLAVAGAVLIAAVVCVALMIRSRKRGAEKSPPESL